MARLPFNSWRLATWALAVLWFASPTPTLRADPPGLSESAENLLRLDSATRDRLAQGEGIVEIAPVILPEKEALLGVNDHFGWPVGVKAGDSLVVVFHRLPTHWGGKDKRNPFSSSAVVVRSTDGGQSWSTPLDLKSLVQTPTRGCRLGFGNTLGLDAGGAVVVVTSYGVFRSEDQGATWRHLSGAFGETQLAGPRTNNGPRLLLHPKYGLVAPGHNTAENAGRSKRNPDGTPYIAPELWMRWSTDDGQSWSETKQDLPEFATPIEPTLLLDDGALLVVARCHGPESFESATGTWRYIQLWSRTGWLPLEAAFSTIRATGVGKGYTGPWTQDTVDLSFNPVTKRIECLATDRNGDAGAGGENQRNCQTLNLWSIAPEAFRQGDSQWQFEGTLLKRLGLMSKGEIDGMHPGAAVIDPAAGVQHIFIYAGQPQGPSGIFRITRSLDTPRVRQWLMLPSAAKK